MTAPRVLVWLMCLGLPALPQAVLPSGTGADIDIDQPYTVPAGTYHYGYLRILAGDP